MLSGARSRRPLDCAGNNPAPSRSSRDDDFPVALADPNHPLCGLATLAYDHHGVLVGLSNEIYDKSKSRRHRAHSSNSRAVQPFIADELRSLAIFGLRFWAGRIWFSSPITGNSQVGKGGLPPLHLDSLKLSGERGQATLPDLRVSGIAHGNWNLLFPNWPNSNPPAAKLLEA